MEKEQRAAAIAATADALAEHVPEKLRDGFKQAFVEVMEHLNEQIDQRLHVFSQDVVPVIQTYAQVSPSEMQTLLTAYAAVVRRFAEVTMNATTSVSNTEVRGLLMDVLRDVVEVCIYATDSISRLAEKRIAERAD